MTRIAALAAAAPALAVASALAVAGCGSAPASHAASPSATQPPASAASSATTSSSPGGGAADVNPAGDIPDNQVFVDYTLPSGAFAVRVPEGWARQESGGAVIFSSHFNDIRLETLPATAAPTVDSARRIELPAIRRQASQVGSEAVTTVTRRAGTAVLVTYQASSPADPVTGRSVRLAVERYELWRAGTEAIVTLSAPVGSDNVDPWRTVTDSFRWT